MVAAVAVVARVATLPLMSLPLAVRLRVPQEREALLLPIRDVLAEAKNAHVATACGDAALHHRKPREVGVSQVAFDGLFQLYRAPDDIFGETGP